MFLIDVMASITSTESHVKRFFLFLFIFIFEFSFSVVPSTHPYRHFHIFEFRTHLSKRKIVIRFFRMCALLLEKPLDVRGGQLLALSGVSGSSAAFSDSFVHACSPCVLIRVLCTQNASLQPKACCMSIF